MKENKDLEKSLLIALELLKERSKLDQLLDRLDLLNKEVGEIFDRLAIVEDFIEDKK